MLITDQVATAPCTDPIQEGCRTFEAKPDRMQMRRLFEREVPEILPMPPDPEVPEPPDDDLDPLPLPPDSNPQPAPVREPDDNPPPITDPSEPEPTRVR